VFVGFGVSVVLFVIDVVLIVWCEYFGCWVVVVVYLFVLGYFY